jgi:taurine transport system permease protein
MKDARFGKPCVCQLRHAVPSEAVSLATAAGVRTVQQDRVNAARSFGASRRQVIRHVVLPSALPSIITGVRIALGAGWTTLVAAELVAATRGLGL